jgi:hypothetical protein
MSLRVCGAVIEQGCGGMHSFAAWSGVEVWSRRPSPELDVGGGNGGEKWGSVVLARGRKEEGGHLRATDGAAR